MRALIIDPAARQAIAQLVAFATAHPLDFETIKRIAEAKEQPPGDNPSYAIHLHEGFRCVFTIDQEYGNQFRHLSVSVNSADPKALPNLSAVACLMHEFGFKRQLGEATIYLEAIGDSHKAVNIMEAMDPPQPPNQNQGNSDANTKQN